MPLDDLLEKQQFLSNDHREVIEAVLSLSQKYRDVIYLHYYEGYTASEISQILGKNVNTIYTLLTRSKKMLRDQLGGEYNE
ncbi:MAG: RNA polymerase sigma factor [Thomasclavelia spiroformis]|uniref:RNA polymerase sigma factor n=1 Tax=Thomasclavelia spiroformis TaxID=29348 RepID=UPI0039913CBD